MFYGSLAGRGVWGRMVIYICMAEPLCWPPKTITLLIDYIPIQNKKFNLKISHLKSIFFQNFPCFHNPIVLYNSSRNKNLILCFEISITFINYIQLRESSLLWNGLLSSVYCCQHLSICGLFVFCVGFFFFFWLHCDICGIIVLQLGIKPMPLAVGAQSPNHCTAREFLSIHKYLV